MEEESLRITASFRRQACFLLSSVEQSTNKNIATTTCARTRTIREMQMSLGRRSILNGDGLFCLEDEKKIQQNFPSLSMQLDMDMPASAIHCHGCGSWLQPGQNATIRLRTLQRGRTRRRRASRQKATQMFMKQQASVAGGRQWNKSNEGTTNNIEDEKLYTVRDGSCRNCIVYTCQECGTKRKIKGVVVVPTSKRKKNTSATVTMTARKTKEAPKNIGGKQRVEISKGMNGTKNATPISEDVDFVPLDNKPQKLTVPQKLSFKPRKKKKEPQKQAKPSSNLHNFLSSLNN